MAFEAEWQSCFANPMTLQQALLGFMVVAALLTIVPGIDTALVLRSSIARSRGYAWATAMGIKTGLLVWGAAAAVGATAILAASEAAYRTMSLAGAVYLMWMGLSFIIRSFPRNGKVPEEHGPQLSGGLWHGWNGSDQGRAFCHGCLRSAPHCAPSPAGSRCRSGPVWAIC